MKEDFKPCIKESAVLELARIKWLSNALLFGDQYGQRTAVAEQNLDGHGRKSDCEKAEQIQWK